MSSAWRNQCPTVAAAQRHRILQIEHREFLAVPSWIDIALAKDAPTPRRVEGVAEGDVIAFREVGGLHHRYERRAA